MSPHGDIIKVARQANFHSKDKMKLNQGKDNELRPKGDSAIEKSWAFAPAYSETGKTLPYDVRIREACELLRVGWTQPVYAPKEAPDSTTYFVSYYTGEEKRFRFHWDDSRKGDKLLITRIK